MTATAYKTEQPFEFKTRAEQRLEWLKTRNRPLTDDEADELYRALHAIYQRDWRHHRAKMAERALTRRARLEDKAENKRLLEKAETEAGWRG